MPTIPFEGDWTLTGFLGAPALAMPCPVAALWYEPVVSAVQVFLPGERTSTHDGGAEVQQEPLQ